MFAISAVITETSELFNTTSFTVGFLSKQWQWLNFMLVHYTGDCAKQTFTFNGCSRCAVFACETSNSSETGMVGFPIPVNCLSGELWLQL